MEFFSHEKAQPGTPLVDEDLFGKVETRPEIAHAADWTLSLKQPNQTNVHYKKSAYRLDKWVQTK